MPTSPPTAAVDGRAPLAPQPVDLPWAPVPDTVSVTASDADAALALWDYLMDDHRGLLDATVA
jgi:hypothetical protein